MVGDHSPIVAGGVDAGARPGNSAGRLSVRGLVASNRRRRPGVKSRLDWTAVTYRFAVTKQGRPIRAG